jgi:hypothetical protein
MSDGSEVFALLSAYQIKAFAEGLIDNLRFDPKTGMLSYEITDQPGSSMLFKVPDDRVTRWRELQAKVIH